LAAALESGDTLKRIDGTEVPLAAPWQTHGTNHRPADPAEQVSTPPGEATAKMVEKTPTPQPPPEAPAKPEAAPAPAPEPAGETAPGEGAGEDAGSKPDLLSQARPEGPDDLKLIKGVGPKLEQELNEKGVFHYDQIAGWTEAEVAWADQHLVRFKGRISRDGWVAQARILAEGGETEFSRRSSKNEE